MTGNKSRILYIKRFLETQTDENHPASMPEILAYLESEGIPAGRKAVLSDMEQLAEFGVDVVCNQGYRNEYFTGERHFELPELALLIDAVQASNFISEKKSTLLITKLSSLAGKHQAVELNRKLYTGKCVKSENERTYITVDLLHRAINTGSRISFKYYEYDQHKKKTYKHNRHTYVFSPYALLWNSDKYYAVGYSDKHGKVITFRIDRIAVPKLLSEPALPKPSDFDISLYTKSVFQMYDGSPIQTVTLSCENSLMKSVIDRFGESVKTEIADDGHFLAFAAISASPTFFGWVSSFGGRMKIAAPEQVAEDYRSLLRQTADSHYYSTN